MKLYGSKRVLIMYQFVALYNEDTSLFVFKIIKIIVHSFLWFKPKQFLANNVRGKIDEYKPTLCYEIL